MRALLATIALVSALSAADGAAAASFDCLRARAPDERAICADRALNDQDVRMATMFGFLRGMFAMGTAGDMGDRQRQWLAERRLCKSDRRCLAAAYDKRVGELQTTYDHIDRPL